MDRKMLHNYFMILKFFNSSEKKIENENFEIARNFRIFFVQKDR